MTGLAGLLDLPPHPAIVATSASSTSGATKAGFHALAVTRRRRISADHVFPPASQISKAATGNSQNVGGVVLPTGNGSKAALAVVVTVMGTLTDEPGATVRGVAGPLHAALVGAPEQDTDTVKGLPVAASCSGKEADWPALMVITLPPGGTVSEKLEPGGGGGPVTVTVSVFVALAPWLSVTVAVTV